MRGIMWIVVWILIISKYVLVPAIKSNTGAHNLEYCIDYLGGEIISPNLTLLSIEDCENAPNCCSEYSTWCKTGDTITIHSVEYECGSDRCYYFEYFVAKFLMNKTSQKHDMHVCGWADK